MGLEYKYQKMKILILNYEFPPLGGGAGNATYYLLKELAKNDSLEVTLITSSTDRYRIEQFTPNIKIIFLYIGKKGNIHYQSFKDLLTYGWKAWQKIRELDKTEKFDLTHAFFTVPCAFVAMWFDTPYIVGLRGSDVPFYSEKFFWLDKIIFQFLNKYIWKKAKKVVANSQGLKELANNIAPNQEIDVIYNGVDTDEFKPAVQNDNMVLNIVSSSRLTKRKGIKYLIEAFNKLSLEYEDINLQIIGSGEEEDNLKILAESTKHREKIQFLGPCPHEQMANHLSQNDIFVLPSLNEGMSNSLLEAMASGLAIVATDTGGTKELVDDDNGIIVEKNSTESIYTALKKLHESKQLLDNMKKQSRLKAEKLSWQKMAGEYINLYHV